MTLETKLSELIGQHVDQAFIDSIYQRLSSKWDIHAVDPIDVAGVQVQPGQAGTISTSRRGQANEGSAWVVKGAIEWLALKLSEFST